MARATFYYQVKEHNDKYKQIEHEILSIFDKNKGRYGYRRIHIALLSKGISISANTVSRLMREMGLKAKGVKRHYHSYKGTVGRIADNVLKRNFTADGPNQKWLTDVSQIEIKGKKCYLSPIVDAWTGEVISYSIFDRPNFEMIRTMLDHAFTKYPKLDGLIMHSDQGWHYQIPRYQLILRNHHIVQSMSRKGNCLDNAKMENFFGLMKKELLYVNDFEDIESFKKELRNYIQYYNNTRIKLKLKMSPVEYRKLHQTQQ